MVRKHGLETLTIPALVAAVVCSGAVTRAADGQGANIAAWGLNNYGQLTVPAGLQAARAADAGPFHGLAVLVDGTVAAWGRNSHGQIVVPAELAAVRAVAGGEYHSVALLDSGQVVCWGGNTHGQCDVPANLPPARAIAAEGYFTVALSRSGTVHAWGSNQWGQLNIPASVPSALEISAGGNYIAALRPDRTVICWGYCGHGQCAVPANMGPVTAIAAGNLHMVALQQDQTVRCWGWNSYGQSVPPTGLDQVVAIAASLHHSLALRANGDVVCWGIGDACVPTGVTAPVVKLSAGWDFTLALLAADEDGDGVDNSTDNCPRAANPDQADGDGNGLGDYCDGPDSDGDGVTDAWDGCPLDAEKAAPGLCGCGEPDIDADGDGVCDSACPADLNGDGVVGASDLPELLNAWGATGPNSADIDSDGLVGPSDLSALLAHWGTACMPTIDLVQPAWGPVAGGTTIIITGRSLTGATSVIIGGVAASSVTVVNPTTLTAVTPSGAAGPRDVVVTTPGGSATLAGGYAYVNPVTWATVLDLLPDPAVVFDADVRARIIATGYPWRVRDNATGIEMLLVPPGNFLMGCDGGSLQHPCSAIEQPAHSVTLPNAFYIGRYEVTQVQWQATMGSNPSYFQVSNGFPDIPNRPVEFVSWTMIQSFLTATGLRLPTEAEWEYAYRSGTTAPFPGFANHPDGTNDDAQAGLFAWYAGNNGGWGWPDWGTKPVGQKAANGFGLHDMGGNLWEWVADWHGPYAADAQANPTGPASGEFRVWRGGGFQHDSDALRASYRGADSPNYADGNVGFRAARSPS